MVEDVLVLVCQNTTVREKNEVLILVVVEDVLVLEVKVPNVEKPIVLILVVVEDVLVLL